MLRVWRVFEERAQCRSVLVLGDVCRAIRLSSQLDEFMETTSSIQLQQTEMNGFEPV